MTENCSCNMFCPCWFAVQEYMIMDQGWCAGSLTFDIEEGPTGLISQVAIDGASDEQARELTAIFQGQRGGTMEILGGLISEWLPVETTSLRTSRDGDNVTASVGNVAQVSSKALRDGEGHGFTLRGGGFVRAFGMEEAELAPSAGTKWSDPDMPREFETTSGARGMVSLSG
jgi:hypothetical protein